MYASTEKKDLVGYTNSYFGGSLDAKKRNSGYVLHLGSNVISWESEKELIVTLSSTKAEYVATTLTTCQVVWLRRFLDGLKQKQQISTTIYCDNTFRPLCYPRIVCFFK